MLPSLTSVLLSLVVISVIYAETNQDSTTHPDTEHNDKSKHRIPKDMCKIVLSKFSQTVADYTECTSKFARPIELCLRCRDEFLAVERAFSYMEDFQQDNISCKVVLTKQDRLGVIEEQYRFATGPDSIWQRGSCKNCYEKNDPYNWKANHTNTFEFLWNATMECFKKYLDLEMTGEEPHGFSWKAKDNPADGTLCKNCTETYNKLRKFFWKEVVPTNTKELLSGVCYDIRDRFNLTGIIWKDTFNCEPRPPSWHFLLPIIIVTIILIVLTYTCEPLILPYMFPKLMEERVNLVQQDIYDGEVYEQNEESEIQGNFEVVPGVTADEYIKRFRSYEITTRADGTKTTIRVPPPPEEFYDLEWNNDEWVLPPKEVLLKMHAVKQRFLDGEIDERQCDLLQCKIIAQDLDRKKHKRKRTGGTSRSQQASTTEDMMQSSVYNEI